MELARSSGSDSFCNSWKAPVPFQPLYSVASLSCCSETVHLVLSYLVDIIVVCTCVYLSLILGRGEFRILLCHQHIGPHHVVVFLIYFVCYKLVTPIFFHFHLNGASFSVPSLLVNVSPYVPSLMIG